MVAGSFVGVKRQLGLGHRWVNQEGGVSHRNKKKGITSTLYNGLPIFIQSETN